MPQLITDDKMVGTNVVLWEQDKVKEKMDQNCPILYQ